MTHDIHIPPEAVEAAARALHARWVIMCVQDGADPLDYERWEGLEDEERDGWRSEATAAIRAMLAAWPGVQHRVLIEQAIILPLTEPRDDAV